MRSGQSLVVVVSAGLAMTSHASRRCGAYCSDGTESFYPTQSPLVVPTVTTTNDQNWDLHAAGGIDFLVAAFFLIAAGWLIVALLYAILVIIVIRLRARGELDIYDENFGRIYLMGRRCYIPLGCLIRRYVIAWYVEGDEDGNRRQQIRFMTREERRFAMETLLISDESSKDDGVSELERGESTPANSDTGLDDDENEDDSSSNEPVCSICLTGYEPTSICFSPTTCQHQFHRDCIMDWLERRANTECPCCRVPIVADEEVWETVQRNRREIRKQRRRLNRTAGCLGLCSRRDPGHDVVESSSTEVSNTASQEVVHSDEQPSDTVESNREATTRQTEVFEDDNLGDCAESTY